MISIEEAKTKLCIGPEGCGKKVLVNADSNPPYVECEQWERRCVADGCMAWVPVSTVYGSCGFLRKENK